MPERFKNYNKLLPFLITIFLISSIVACNFNDAFPPPPKPPQTRILKIEILPNDTLAPGDTATFKCFIEDSLDSRFKFIWSLDGDNRNSIMTNSNSIDWIAPNEIRKYGHSVRVDNGSPDSSVVFKEFEVTVIR